MVIETLTAISNGVSIFVTSRHVSMTVTLFSLYLDVIYLKETKTDQTSDKFNVVSDLFLKNVCTTFQDKFKN